MNIAPCNCESQTAKQSVNEHPRYYARQLVTPEDMTLEHDYLRAKLRRHNRYMHGWGVVCGADVVLPTQQTPPPWKVVVKTGYILGPYGDEICIEKDQCVDVRKMCGTEPEMPLDDCEFTEAQPPAPPGGTLYVAIRYVENKTRLIRVPLGGCGCEDNACEYSRLSDGYEICIIDHCANLDEVSAAGNIGVQNSWLECPKCPTEPWVVLAAFTVDDEGAITLLAGDTCRRQLPPPWQFSGVSVAARENLGQSATDNAVAETAKESA
jgi:hypothetical protein